MSSVLRSKTWDRTHSVGLQSEGTGARSEKCGPESVFLKEGLIAL